jgi:integrase
MKSRQFRQVERTRKNGKTYKIWIIDIKGMKMPDGSLVPQIKHKSPLQSSEGTRHYKDQVVQAVLLGKYDFTRKSIRVEGEPIKVKAPESTAPTLAAFADKFIEDCRLEKKKPTYIETHESMLRAHLLPMFKDRKLDTFSSDDEMALKRRLASRVWGGKKSKLAGKPSSQSRSTYNNPATTMNMLLRCAVKKKQIAMVPYKFTAFKREETHAGYYDFDIYELIVEAAYQIATRTHLIVLLGGDAGLRRGEILGLQRRHLDFRAGVIYVEVAVSVVKVEGVYRAVEHPTKGWERRSVPMTDRLMAALLAYPIGPRGPRLIQPDGDAAYVSDKAFNLWMRKPQARVVTDGVPPDANGEVHILRHTFCSHLAMRGASLASIRELAGHQRVSTTQKYMHLAPGEGHRAIGLLNNRKEWVDELLSDRTRRALPRGSKKELEK